MDIRLKLKKALLQLGAQPSFLPLSFCIGAILTAVLYRLKSWIVLPFLSWAQLTIAVVFFIMAVLLKTSARLLFAFISGVAIMSMPCYSLYLGRQTLASLQGKNVFASGKVDSDPNFKDGT